MLESLAEIRSSLYLLSFTVSGLMMMVGLRRQALWLLGATLVSMIRWPLLQALGRDLARALPPELAVLQGAFPYLLVGAVAVLLILRTRFVRSFILTFLVTVAVDLFYALLKAPFRLLGRLFRRRTA